MSATDPMLQYFEHAHLSEQLRRVSAPFASMAKQIVDTIPRSPERTVGLRKLLEAKDCIVRASLYRPEE